VRFALRLRTMQVNLLAEVCTLRKAAENDGGQLPALDQFPGNGSMSGVTKWANKNPPTRIRTAISHIFQFLSISSFAYFGQPSAGFFLDRDFFTRSFQFPLSLVCLPWAREKPSF